MDNSKIRLHIPAIPYTITRDEYSHDAYTGKVKRFAPMMRSVGFEVYHYGVETSESGATKDIQLMTKDEWTNLRIKTLQYLEPGLSLEEATKKNSDPTLAPAILSNWSSPLTKEFNKQFRVKIVEHFRSNSTDIICLPLGKTHHAALDGLKLSMMESGIGYSDSHLDFRVFESYCWMTRTLIKENKPPSYYSFVIPNYFDTNEFKLCLTPTPLKVGFLGRLGTGKGCGIIVEIARRFPTVQFILCGAGDPAPFLNAPNIVYKAPIHGEERSDYLGSCVAVLCLSKYFEPFCGVAVEAQLCGTPVISTDWGGMVETIEHGITGIRGHTLADFCLGVQMALDGKFDRAYIRDRAVRMFDMYKLAYDYENAIKTVMDVHNGKGGWYSPNTHIKTNPHEDRLLMVDMIYYINLDKRVDRNTHMLEQFKKHNIPSSMIKRFTAINGNNYEFKESELALFENADFIKWPFAKKIMGNQLSHFSIYKDMLKNKYKNVLILQDDVVFRENFISYLNDVVRELPSDCEIANIGMHEYANLDKFVAYDLTKTNDHVRIEKTQISEHICILKNNIQPCSLSYVMTELGAQNIIKHFEQSGFPYATDISLNRYLIAKNIFYGSRMILCTGNPSFGSDIFGPTLAIPIEDQIEVYIINITQERREFLEKQFESLQLKLKVTFFKAYTPENSQDYLYKGISKWKIFQEKSQSAVRSHVNVIKEWYDTSKRQYVLVLEDDVSLMKENFIEKLKKVLDIYNDNKDIGYVSIGYLPVFDKDQIPVKKTALGRKHADNVYWDFLNIGYFVWGCQAQIYDKERAKKIIDILYHENANLLETAVENYVKSNKIHALKYLSWCPDILFSMLFSQAIVSPPLAIEKNYVSTVGQKGYEIVRYNDLCKAEEHGILCLKDYYDF